MSALVDDLDAVVAAAVAALLVSHLGDGVLEWLRHVSTAAVELIRDGLQ